MADENKVKSIDQASLDMLAKASEEGISTVFDRADAMKPCPIGADGSCCKNCAMGPCRIPLGKGKEETPEEHAKRIGVCGADAETIAARNFVRMIAAGTASHSDHGRRVVEGQRLMQATTDVFLGWTEEAGDRHYYWRQFHDMKGSFDLDGVSLGTVRRFAKLCGWTLARAHARSGDPIAIAGYLGSGEVFDRSLAEFAVRYTGQNLVDYAAFTEAIADGRVAAEED